MREQKFRARDKVVQKMTRDGISEKNLADGTEQGISQRQADFSFQRTRAGGRDDGTAGRQDVPQHPFGMHSHGKGPPDEGKRRRQISRPVREGRQTEAAYEQRPNAQRGSGRLQPQTADSGSPVHFSEKEHSGAAGAEEGPKLHVSGTEVQEGSIRENISDTYRNEKIQGQSHHTSVSRTQIKKRIQRENAETRREDNPASFSLEADEKQKTAGEKRKTEFPEQERAGKLPETADEKPGNISRKLEKGEKRLENAKRKLEKAEAKLPPEHRKKPGNRSGSGGNHRRNRRLQFEPEPVPGKQGKPLRNWTGGRLVHSAQSTAIRKVHQKVRETEQDNVGVESAQKAESAAERIGSRAYRMGRERLRTRPYRAVKRAEMRVMSAERNAAYQKFLAENPELQKKKLARWVQKQKIKRKYAEAARKAARGTVRGGERSARILAASGKTAGHVVQYFKGSKTALGIVVLAVLILAVSGSLFTSCSSMFMGMESAVTSACYPAEEAEINRSELRYTEMETDLQLEIANTERDYPGYDEYRYNIGEVGHNPYELMGYLSAVFEDFTYAQVEAELERLSQLQYRLTRETVVETRAYTDEEGEEQEYEWRILKTVLSVQPLSGILSGSFENGDQRERYDIYMETCGSRQYYGNPFGFSWLGYVSSPYGYRVHPLSGGKNLHRGVDIAVASGTPILAIQDGRVVSAGYAGDYGLCVVIEGENGYQSRYAHCSATAVSTGQEVKQGEVVAYVGDTGSTTGSHLHLEIAHNGEYLNPYYFVDNGGGGYTAAGNAAGSVQFPVDPGRPMGNGTFDAMLEEAERYMGLPYVWGGSSPATSFDCSGYVSWVINQSGAGSVGRQTAQGLCNLCTPVSWENLQPGDLVFFTGTYSSPTPVSHVGIYVGGGRMAHAGDPIGYADIGSSRYWKEHFYCGGRLP